MKHAYDRTIGYSPLKDVNRDKMRLVIRINKEIIRKYAPPGVASRILVAGAGRGDEAELIFDEFAMNTVGVDLNLERPEGLRSPANLSFLRQNLENLAFSTKSFGLIYCYHVLEHVSDHMAVLREFERVLMPGGVLFIGFPNRHRLVSYIGTSQEASIPEKIKWNLIDYSYRLKGRFENKYGAHAGFSEDEFLAVSMKLFPEVVSVRNEYMSLKYRSIKTLLNWVARAGLGEFLFPSNYYVCIK
ncbi:MAG: class I SAM-dependent methyltransferase [Chloroflexi bacterium]|nr:class I SAM-dependent methyltransferase [Chloroflexota bacterium]